ncbi:DUF211 domain-containing protein [Methylohalobius crimeensis]|uniref:DUF211 domain-containing protein n=1 Tax=Methylohalobius crimeensis TaxID=244365 RepID=UPI0003B51FCA|nr:DUF211 domain-containing protein [Methylohalobius crimeensis]
MPVVTRLVLDVLKPHQPNALEFVQSVLMLDSLDRVKLTVEEMDEKTESVILLVEGVDIQYQELVDVIASMGGSVHSLDEVDLTKRPAPEDESA